MNFKINLIEPNLNPIHFFRKLKKNNLITTEATSIGQNFSAKNATLIFSYSINEIKTLDEKFYEAHNIIFLEPSTKFHSQNLIKMRSDLMQKGFHPLAPCPHALDCPLKGSKTDWCHDRAHVTLPPWIESLESFLPIKNKTLSFSYLIMSKTPPQEASKGLRLIGDEQHDKGKTRWLACLNQERLFFSWLHKKGAPPDYKRGDLIDLKDYEIKGNEIRSL